VVEGIRAQYSWVPLPTFTFPVWLGGLILGVLLLLALTPVVSRGAPWIRVVSLILGVVMTGNALGHIAASVYWGKFAPGVYSSPLLLIAALALLVTASRAKVQFSLPKGWAWLVLAVPGFLFLWCWKRSR
jgi:hypothetical protein